MRKNTSDLFVIDEVFKKKVYGDRPTGVVFDIGANIGDFSLYAAKAADQVFAFEPESTNLVQAQKNVDLNDYDNITIFPNAVGGSNRSATLYMADGNKGRSSISRKVSYKSETVQMITVDEAFELSGVDKIDMLKVDIEGGEYELFENASKSFLEKVDYIIMEYHRVQGKSPEGLTEILENAGFKVKKESKLLSIPGQGILIATRD